MARLFGTDGIRGVANVDLTPALAHDLGRAVGHLLKGDRRRVVIGQDTRRSGDMLTAALAAGLSSIGVDVVELGVVTTPCLAFVAGGGAFEAGIMVSASHNPASDNGLKVLSGGRKIDDEAEDRLERLIFQAESLPGPGNDGLGRIVRDPEPIADYLVHLVDAAGDAFEGLRIAVDCANGSASVVAPELFRSLGAEVTAIFAEPDGTNINAGCGSTNPETMARIVRDRGLDLGFAFDGDADRLIAADERGELVDGDLIMGICALDRLARGTLRNDLLVVSVMSNGGLERVVTGAGGRVVRTPVGDRHVFEAMERADAVMGGEQSGHIIFRDRATTGDGLLSAYRADPDSAHERGCAAVRARRPDSEAPAGDDKLSRPSQGPVAGGPGVRGRRDQSHDTAAGSRADPGPAFGDRAQDQDHGRGRRPRGDQRDRPRACPAR